MIFRQLVYVAHELIGLSPWKYPSPLLTTALSMVRCCKPKLSPSRQHLPRRGITFPRLRPPAATSSSCDDSQLDTRALAGEVAAPFSSLSDVEQCTVACTPHLIRQRPSSRLAASLVKEENVAAGCTGPDVPSPRLQDERLSALPPGWEHFPHDQDVGFAAGAAPRRNIRASGTCHEDHYGCRRSRGREPA